MAAQANLLCVMVIAARALHGGTGKGMEYSASRHLHTSCAIPYIEPQHLAKETLMTYPVPIERQDIYKQFLLPAVITPKKHKTIETTDIMMQMVASVAWM